MSIKFRLIGNGEFDSLGLTSASCNKRLCTFIEDEKYASDLSDSVSLVLTNEKSVDKFDFPNKCVVDNPRLTFFRMHNHLSENELYKRQSFKTIIGKNCSISPLACISNMNVIIGDNVVIEEFVSIKGNTIIGNNVVIRTGVVLGGEGFEEKRTVDGTMSVIHLGGVKIGNNVDIHQNTCVDKAIYPWDDTLISDGCRIDILSHIAHAVKLGENVFVAGLAAIAGRTVVGKNTWIGPRVCVRNGIMIGANARLNMGAVVTREVLDGQAVSGNFAIDHEKFIENMKRNNK